MAQRLFQPMDSSKFRAQVAQIYRAGHRIVRCSGGQLKVGQFSYYPETGAILRDGSTKERARGINALLDLLDGKAVQERPRPARPTRPKRPMHAEPDSWEEDSFERIEFRPVILIQPDAEGSDATDEMDE